VGDGLVVAHVDDLDLSGDRVAGSHRGAEVPGDVQEHGAGPGKVLGHDRVQNRGRDSALHDDLAEPRGASGLLVIVQRVAVPADCGEPLDIGRSDLP
jgi:hypothetical protein